MHWVLYLLGVPATKSPLSVLQECRLLRYLKAHGTQYATYE